MYVVYPAVFYKDIDTGGYVVSFPDFKGATQGEDESDAMYMAQDWLGCALYDSFIGKKEFPKASSINDIDVDDEFVEFSEGSFISLVGVDIAEYVKKVNKKSVKKTLTIPSYLNEMAKSMNLNFSQVLQDALKQEMDLD